MAGMRYQPQGRARVNPAFNAALVLVGGQAADPVSGKPYTIGSNITRGAFPPGLGYVGASSNTQIKLPGNMRLRYLVPSTAPITVAFRFTYQSAGTNQAIFCDSDSGGSGGSVQIWVNSSNQLCGSIHNQAGTGVSITSSSACVNGATYDGLFCHVPGVGQYLYLNGVLVASGTDALSATTQRWAGSGASDPSWMSLGNWTSSYQYRGKLYFGAVLAGDYRPMAKSLAVNPWALFLDDDQDEELAAAGGGTRHTLAGSDSSQANTSSTGAIVQRHQLAAAATTQTNTSSTGAASARHVLAGSTASQSNTSSAGAVVQRHILAGAASYQLNLSPGGAVELPSPSAEVPPFEPSAWRTFRFPAEDRRFVFAAEDRRWKFEAENRTFKFTP
jgi:hypothetical protein